MCSSAMKFQDIHFFAIGFLIGSSMVLLPFYYYNKQRVESNRVVIEQNFHENDYQDQFNLTLSNILFNEVKILCMVMTMPENHRKKAIHIKNTWGRRCNKLLFVSSENDSLLDVIVLQLEESREALWNKTKASFMYLHDNYLQDYDWFLKADDDK